MDKNYSSRTIYNRNSHQPRREQTEFHTTRPPSNDLPPIQVDTNSFFEKKFNFVSNSWLLPCESLLFTTGKFVYEPLEKLKDELNFTKNKLNDYELQEWNQHTTRRNPANEIIVSIRSMKCEFVTNAWCKMYEIINTYAVVDASNKSVKSMHLCEAPGGFITSLNHYLKQHNHLVEFTWMATTLNPYYEGNNASYTIFDDRFILPSLAQWYFGTDYTGNIMNPDNIEGLRKHFSNVDLVTADGSIDCHDQPEEQEKVVSKLHLTEAIVAMKLLAEGGSFVLKMFTLFEDSSCNLMYLLNCCFREVNVFKPATSKGGNSEIYVVCLKYDKSACEEQYLNKLLANISSENNMFPLYALPETFLKQLVGCAKFFKEQQETVIENNIYNFRNDSEYELKKLSLLRSEVVDQYFDRYDLQRIDDTHRLYPKYCYSQNFFNLNPRGHEGSFSDRLSQKAKSTSEKLQEIKQKCIHYRTTYPADNIYEILTIPVTGDTIDKIFHLTIGKKITRLNSTKFLLGPLIQLFNELIDAKTLDGNQNVRFIQQNRLETKLDRKYLRTCVKILPNTFLKLVTVSYNTYEKDLFFDIIEVLLKSLSQEFQVVVIENLLMLSQFMVGLMYFLKLFVFEVILFDRNGRIELRKFKAGSKSHLQALKTLITQCRLQRDDEAVLGFVEIQKLFYNCEFYALTVKYNINACLKYCDEYLRNVDIG